MTYDQHIQEDSIKTGGGPPHLEERAVEKTQLFHVVAQHSNRTLYHYDLKSGATQPWDATQPDVLRRLYDGRYSEDSLTENPCLMPDSRETAARFFSDIHRGAPAGDANVHVRLEDGEQRWYQFRYTSFFRDGAPVSALISVEDLTRAYERQISHILLRQSLEFERNLSYVVADLTDDRLERYQGKGLWNAPMRLEESYSVFLENFYFGLTAEDCDKAHVFYRRDNLLNWYCQGCRHTENLWRQEGAKEDAWVVIKLDLIEDPINRHVKMYARMVDVTAQQEELMDANRRADHDAMTGLLNRASAEARVNRQLARDHAPGILLLVDLDDLKGINDTFGHKAGDAAIMGISSTLRSHFRESDILARIGGDEFLAFLPGAAKNRDAIAASISALLRKLSSISVGDGEGRRLHCSVGCAVQSGGSDTLDDLFRQADLALYHVKRSGKNSYAFYIPEMEQEDYQFRTNKMLSSQDGARSDPLELQYLLDAIANLYLLILSMNLSANSYYIMEEVNDGVFANAPAIPTLDGFLHMTAQLVHPRDVDRFHSLLSREALLRMYREGTHRVKCYFRFYNEDGYRWVESNHLLYVNSEGDVCCFALIRWEDEHAHRLERLFTDES